MKLTRNKLRQLIMEQATQLPRKPIDIVYNGYQNQYDQSQFDFKINGQFMSTPPSSATHPSDIAHALSDLISTATGITDIKYLYQTALNFLMNNQQFQTDLISAEQDQFDYPGY